MSQRDIFTSRRPPPGRVCGCEFCQYPVTRHWARSHQELCRLCYGIGCDIVAQLKAEMAKTDPERKLELLAAYEKRVGKPYPK